METSAKPQIQALIDGSDQAHRVFRPTAEFYASVGIKRKRFGQIYRGEKAPLLTEIQALAKYFGLRTSEFFKEEKPELLTAA